LSGSVDITLCSPGFEVRTPVAVDTISRMIVLRASMFSFMLCTCKETRVSEQASWSLRCNAMYAGAASSNEKHFRKTRRTSGFVPTFHGDTDAHFRGAYSHNSHGKRIDAVAGRSQFSARSTVCSSSLCLLPVAYQWTSLLCSDCILPVIRRHVTILY
jgi:hypothetical protein